MRYASLTHPTNPPWLLADRSITPLFYGEIKINAGNRYHVIPRSRPS
ncbi:DUF6972 family protein [Leptolyngbya sp. PCC 6406]